MIKPKNHRDGSVYVIEPEDRVMIGGALGETFGVQGELVLITFQSSESNRNDVAFTIPKRAWASFVKALASGKNGEVSILEKPEPT